MKWPNLEDHDAESPVEAAHKADANGTYPLIKQKEGPATTLRQRIASTVREAQAQRNLELKRASDRARAERQEIVDKAKAAVLSLLSDDVISLIIGKHAGLGELNAGAVKVTKHGVELLRGGGAAASHMVGDKLNIGFDGAILQAGQQLQSPEVEARVSELMAQGIKIDSSYDASTQGLLISFDYGMALK